MMTVIIVATNSKTALDWLLQWTQSIWINHPPKTKLAFCTLEVKSAAAAEEPAPKLICYSIVEELNYFTDCVRTVMCCQIHLNISVLNHLKTWWTWTLKEWYWLNSVSAVKQQDIASNVKHSTWVVSIIIYTKQFEDYCTWLLCSTSDICIHLRHLTYSASFTSSTEANIGTCHAGKIHLQSIPPSHLSLPGPSTWQFNSVHLAHVIHTNKDYIVMFDVIYSMACVVHLTKVLTHLSKPALNCQ